MAEENRGVDETGEDKGRKPIIDPETGEVTGYEEGGKPAEEKPPSEDETWEKRYKDVQAQKDKEVSAAQNEVTRYKTLLSPFAENIKKKDDGSLVFAFPDTSSERKEQPAEVQEPTEEEWYKTPGEAMKKFRAVIRADIKAEQDSLQRERDLSKADKDYNTTCKEDWEVLQGEYPDLKDENSQLFQGADKFLRAHSGIISDPRYNRIAVERVALEMGVKPQSGDKPAATETSPATKKDTSYIIGGPGGSGGKPGSAKKPTEEEFANMSPEEQRKWMAGNVGL